MPKKDEDMPTWTFLNRKSKQELEAEIKAHWEVSLDPISDDYTPDEISARDLLRQWVKKVQAKHPNNLIPIFWFVRFIGKNGSGSGFEWMPTQYDHLGRTHDENFLTFFTYPVSSLTGERLNWFMLPVVDKLWNSHHANKGGFVQQATGWKPSILQPYIYLPTLIAASEL
jgi:hypothetical protein